MRYCFIFGKILKTGPWPFEQPANQNKSLTDFEKEHWQNFVEWFKSNADDTFYFIDFEEVPPHLRGII